MKLENDIAQHLEQGEFLALATIIDRSGSAPRHAGAQMLVTRDLSVIGTIGGGQVESDVLAACLPVRKGGTARLMHFDMTGFTPDADMICGDKPVPRDDQKFPACPVDQRVNHGDVVKIGNMPWKVISTPGHTEGSMCLFLDSSLTERLDAKPVLIAGDTLFFGSIGRTDFSGGSMSAMRKSLKRLAVLPDDTVVLPGHGNLTTIGGERRRVFAFYA